MPASPSISDDAIDAFLDRWAQAVAEAVLRRIEDEDQEEIADAA